MHILEFKLDGDLGEGQVVYLQEGDNDMEVSEHNGQNEEGVEVNEAAGLCDFELLLNEGCDRSAKECSSCTLSPLSKAKKKDKFSIVELRMSELPKSLADYPQA